MKMQHKLKLVYFHFFNITVNLEIYSFSMDYIKTKRLDSIVIQAIKKCEKLKCIFGGFVSCYAL